MRQAHNLKVLGSNPSPATNSYFSLGMLLFPKEYGKSEIVPSLKTTDPAEAAVAAKKLREVWIAKL